MFRQSLLICAFLTAIAIVSQGQTIEFVGLQEIYKGSIGETIKVPLKLKNNSDKPVLLVIRKVTQDIGTSQKNYFCLDNNCLDQKTEDHLVRLEPNQTLNSLHVALEAGLAQGNSSIKYLVFNKTVPAETIEFELNFVVDEVPEKADMYSSAHVILHDVYPNPVKDIAFADYSVLNEKTKAKLIIHNILGNTIEEYPLPASENKVKIRAESLSSGIYFFTLYVDNEGVVTRKFIVKK